MILCSNLRLWSHSLNGQNCHILRPCHTCGMHGLGVFKKTYRCLSSNGFHVTHTPFEPLHMDEKLKDAEHKDCHLTPFLS